MIVIFLLIIILTIDEYDRKSCTILINNKPVCVHDGTWKECEVREVFPS